ncbi:MAG TPA: hypothetical protein VFG71_12065 [Nitrospiraceae bacterium]|nr:hypothetical protein [Nitrospiraceae bacterium]
METANRKRLVLLVGLGLVWVCLLGWQLLYSEEPARMPLKNTTGGVVTGPRSPAATAGGLHVNLDLLTAASGQREASFATPRNIFASLSGKGSMDKAVAQDVAPEQRLPTPAEERRLAAAAELNQFRYLGFFRFGGVKSSRQKDLAVLVRDDELHVVHAGDTIEKEVIVRSVRSDRVTLQHLGSRLVQEVQVTQEPLTGTPQN